jgi:hypothetical protein
METLDAQYTGWLFLLIPLLIWSLAWKGLALWRAARRGETTWFVVLLIVNTLGLLEIIYYFLIAKTDKK